MFAWFDCSFELVAVPVSCAMICICSNNSNIAHFAVKRRQSPIHYRILVFVYLCFFGGRISYSGDWHSSEWDVFSLFEYFLRHHKICILHYIKATTTEEYEDTMPKRFVFQIRFMSVWHVLQLRLCLNNICQCRIENGEFGFGFWFNKFLWYKFKLNADDWLSRLNETQEGRRKKTAQRAITISDNVQDLRLNSSSNLKESFESFQVL